MANAEYKQLVGKHCQPLYLAFSTRDVDKILLVYVYELKIALHLAE